MNMLRYFRFVCMLVKAKVLKQRVPLVVILGVTNRCNLSCCYCYGEHSQRNGWIDFTTKELLEMIRSLHKMGTQFLQLQGGEPLLRDDLQIIINEAHKYGMVCDMVTNGTLITQKLEVVNLLDKICISLDGPSDVNDGNRGKGTYNRVIEGIKAVCDLGLPVRISSVLTSKTSKESIDWLIDFALKYHLLVNFSPSFEFASSVESSETKVNAMSDDSLRSIFNHILMHKKKGAPIQFTEKSYAIAAQWPFTYRKKMVYSNDISVDFKHPKCCHGEYVFFIDSDGSLYPCCNFWGRSKLNVRTDGLENSILRLNRQDCQGCYIPAYIERNLFFNGAPKVWWNYIKQIVKGGV